MESATKSDFDINSVVGVRWGTEYPSYSHQFGFTSLSAGISRRPRRPGDLISQGDAPDRQGPTSASCSSVCGSHAAAIVAAAQQLRRPHLQRVLPLAHVRRPTSMRSLWRVLGSAPGGRDFQQLRAVEKIRRNWPVVTARRFPGASTSTRSRALGAKCETRVGR